jgi:hypothetical protein
VCVIVRVMRRKRERVCVCARWCSNVTSLPVIRWRVCSGAHWRCGGGWSQSSRAGQGTGARACQCRFSALASSVDRCGWCGGGGLVGLDAAGCGAGEAGTFAGAS